MQEEPGAHREQRPDDQPQHSDGPPGSGPLPSPVTRPSPEKTAQRLLGSKNS